MEQLFVALYPLVAIVSLAAYIPQIMELVKAKNADDKISLKSWCLWIFTYTLTLGYGITHLKDPMFIATTIFGLAAIVTVVGLVTYNRYFRFSKPIEVELPAAVAIAIPVMEAAAATVAAAGEVASDAAMPEASVIQ